MPDLPPARRGATPGGMDDDALLSLAARLADQAAAAINAVRAAGFAVNRKSDQSPVTEADHIAEVLRLTAGNKSRAARVLGISRQGLIEKLRRTRSLDESGGRQVS